VLAEESHVARVIDPAGGSWYVEDLTGQLALRGWSCFQDIERAGGLRAALASGHIAGQLAASRQDRRASLARRREAVTGVSAFPLVGEALLNRPPGQLAKHTGGLPRIRWAQWHEELRDRADAYAAATGAPPTVTLAILDTSRASAAQAGQVTGLLAPAGIATVTADPESAAALAPGAVVVVCGSTEADPEKLRAAVERARGRGACFVAVAGGSAQVPPADEVISDDLDLLAFGGRLLAALGAA
jgi:methylmalonyl-CoA mutase